MATLKEKMKLQTKIRDIIYDYVYENFGESEANDPSWYIPTLAEEIADRLLDGDNYTPQHPYHNDEDDMEAEDNDEELKSMADKLGWKYDEKTHSISNK